MPAGLFYNSVCVSEEFLHPYFDIPPDPSHLQAPRLLPSPYVYTFTHHCVRPLALQVAAGREALL